MHTILIQLVLTLLLKKILFSITADHTAGVPCKCDIVGKRLRKWGTHCVRSAGGHHLSNLAAWTAERTASVPQVVNSYQTMLRKLPSALRPFRAWSSYVNPRCGNCGAHCVQSAQEFSCCETWTWELLTILHPNSFVATKCLDFICWRTQCAPRPQ